MAKQETREPIPADLKSAMTAFGMLYLNVTAMDEDHPNDPLEHNPIWDDTKEGFPQHANKIDHLRELLRRVRDIEKTERATWHGKSRMREYVNAVLGKVAETDPNAANLLEDMLFDRAIKSLGSRLFFFELEDVRTTVIDFAQELKDARIPNPPTFQDTLQAILEGRLNLQQS
jgi:hypothetical protein